MTFQEAIKSVFSNYATFSGRARRSEYWYFVLFSALISLCLSFLNTLTKGSFLGTVTTALQSIVSIGLFIPSLAVAWRRLHDIGRSGAWYFIGLIPVIGWIIMIIWYAKDSQPGVNQYGPCPKDIIDVF